MRLPAPRGRPPRRAAQARCRRRPAHVRSFRPSEDTLGKAGGKSGDGGELGDRCRLDAGEAAEALEQQSPPVGPTPGIFSSSEVMVRCVRRFRLYARPKRCASSRARCSNRSDGLRRDSRRLSLRPGRKTSSSRLARLDHRYAAESKPGGRLHGGAELSLAAVDHDQIGQRERLRLPPRRYRVMTSSIAAKSSCCPGPLILNFRYSLLLRPSGLEPDQRADRVAPLVVRDVDANEAAGNDAQAEVASQGVDRVLGPLLGFERFDPEALEQVAGVLVGQLQPARAVPRCGTGHSVPGHQFAQRVPSVRRKRDNQPACPAFRRDVVPDRKALSTARRPASSSTPSRNRCSRPTTRPPRTRIRTPTASSPSRA